MKMRLNIDGKAHEVEVQFLDDAESPASIHRSAPLRAGIQLAANGASPPPLAGMAPSSGGNSIAAPLAGLIVQVCVQPGDAVKAGQQVLTLEAMKMATNINAPRDGRIKSVAVNKGQTVKQGEVMIELE